MIKAIDTRLRIPYKTFADSLIFKSYAGYVQTTAKTMKLGVADSAVNRSMELLFKEMDEAQVKMGIVVIREQDNFGYDEVKDLLANHSDRFMVSPHLEVTKDIEASLTKIDQYVLSGLCQSVYLEPGFTMSAHPMHANEEHIFPVYEKCQENNIPIILQYGGSSNTTKYYDPLDLDDIFAAFPELKICISHGGWPQASLFVHQAYRLKNLYLSPDLYFNGWPMSHDYVMAANSLLQDKILFGSAYPLTSLEHAMQMHKSAIDDENILAKILYKNACDFLGMPYSIIEEG